MRLRHCHTNHIHTGQLTCSSDNVKDKDIIDALQGSQQSSGLYIARVEVYDGQAVIENAIPQLLEELDELLSSVGVTI